LGIWYLFATAKIVKRQQQKLNILESLFCVPLKIFVTFDSVCRDMLYQKFVKTKTKNAFNRHTISRERSHKNVYVEEDEAIIILLENVKNK
jgi:hypothetical protein